MQSSQGVVLYLKDSSRNKFYIKIDNINLTNTIISDYNGSNIEKRNLSNDISKATFFEKVYIGNTNNYHLKVSSSSEIDLMLLSIPEKKTEIGIHKYLCIDTNRHILKLVDFYALHNSSNNKYMYVWNN